MLSLIPCPCVYYSMDYMSVSRETGNKHGTPGQSSTYVGAPPFFSSVRACHARGLMWCTGILVPMARARTPEGKRVVIPVRVSEPLAADLDRARGELTRSAWVRGVLSAYLAADGGGQVSTVHEPAHSPQPVYVHPEPEHKQAATAETRPPRTPRADACPHPRARILKGLCNACGTHVG